MNILKKATSVFIATLIFSLVLAEGSFSKAQTFEIMGNSDLNIQNGGVMLTSGDDFYFSEGGIFVENEDTVKPLSADMGKNLNLYKGYIYYTLGHEVHRVKATGGSSELVHTAVSEIKQMYVVSGALRYLAGGTLYELSENSNVAIIKSSISNIKGLIPTEFGDILLTGNELNYTIWVDGTSLISGVSSCYTDKGYLAISKENQNYMVELQKLFSGFSESRDMQKFDIHGETQLAVLFDIDSANKISENNDNDALLYDFQAMLKAAGLEKAVLLDEPPGQSIIPEVSQGQKNIVKRGRQLCEIEWTPLEDLPQWDNLGVFKAETTYQGIPYGQPVNNNGYIGYGVSIDTFATSVLDNSSKYYTSYSTYNKSAPAFSGDCSSFLSYAWGLTSRKTTYSLTQVATKVGNQSIYSLQVGDCLNETSSHVVLVSELRYNIDGNIIGVTIMEQTPVITRVTSYGDGEKRTLASLQSYYLGGGYVIYRNPERDSVSYTPNPYVPLDGEYFQGMKDKAPKSKTTAIAEGKKVALSAESTIYYTLNGTAPTTNSPRYSGEITVYDTTKLRAISVSGAYSSSAILEYTIKVPQLSKPTAVVSSGTSKGNVLSADSKISLAAETGAKIYYTIDGTDPKTAGQIYSAPISVSKDMTIKAMAVASGSKNSEVAVFDYKISKGFVITASAETNGKISPSGKVDVFQDGSQVFTITPNSGFSIKDVLVDGASVGAVSSYTFSNVQSTHTISASFKSGVNLPFTDVPKDAWFFESVSFTYANNLFNGTSTTTFSPNEKMTRAMFVTVLGRFAGIPNNLSSGIGIVTASSVNIRRGASTDTEVAGVVTNKNTVVQVLSKSGDFYKVTHGNVTGFIRSDLIKVYSSNYTDLQKNQYHSPYAEWVYLTGIASGVAGTTFNSFENISREHMCMLLYNYSTFYGRKLPVLSSKATFSDDSQISANAKTAVYALQQAGIISGLGDGTFSPKGLATRAEVAKIFKYFASVAN